MNTVSITDLKQNTARVINKIDKVSQTITIIKIAHRKEVYR